MKAITSNFATFFHQSELITSIPIPKNMRHVKLEGPYRLLCLSFQFTDAISGASPWEIFTIALT